MFLFSSSTSGSSLETSSIVACSSEASVSVLISTVTPVVVVAEVVVSSVPDELPQAAKLEAIITAARPAAYLLKFFIIVLPFISRENVHDKLFIIISQNHISVNVYIVHFDKKIIRYIAEAFFSKLPRANKSVNLILILRTN